MILPTEHLRPESSLLGVGAEILDVLKSPVNVSTLWDRIRARRVQSRAVSITYAWFVLALDLLYLMGTVELQGGVLGRAMSPHPGNPS